MTITDKQDGLKAMLAGNPDKQVKLGNIPIPQGYALMRCARGYYFLKYDGERSDVNSDRFTVYRWIKANQEWSLKNVG